MVSVERGSRGADLGRVDRGPMSSGGGYGGFNVVVLDVVCERRSSPEFVAFKEEVRRVKVNTVEGSDGRSGAGRWRDEAVKFPVRNDGIVEGFRERS